MGSCDLSRSAGFLNPATHVGLVQQVPHPPQQGPPVCTMDLRTPACPLLLEKGLSGLSYTTTKAEVEEILKTVFAGPE